MCDCPAYQSLVDCTCSYDHTNDRLIQLREKIRAYENECENRWRWLKSTVNLQLYGFEEPLPKTGSDLADYITVNATALTAELGEALKEVGWKPWSQPRGWLNRSAFLGECVDMGHFLANMLAAAGISDDEWEAAYQRKQQVNLERQARGYDTRKEKCPACGRAYDDNGVRCRPAQTNEAGVYPDERMPYCEDYGTLEITTA